MASVWHMGFEFSEPRDRSLLSLGILDAVADAVASMGSEATAVVMDEDMHGGYWFKITFDE